MVEEETDGMLVGFEAEVRIGGGPAGRCAGVERKGRWRRSGSLGGRLRIVWERLGLRMVWSGGIVARRPRRRLCIVLRRS